MSKTGDQLLDAVKRTVTVPASQPLLQDTDILAFASEEQASKMVPLLITLRQEYLLRVERQPLLTNIDQYDIPYRAVGRMLQDLKLFDGVQTRRMARLQTNDVQLFSYNAIPHSFYFRGDKFVVVPVPVFSTQLFAEMWFYLKPNDLTTTSNAGQVQSVVNDTVTVNMVPSSFQNGSLVDVIQNRSGCSMLAYDARITNISGLSITLAPGSLTTAVAPSPVPTVLPGDWVSLAQTSPVMQLPEEAFQYLVYLTSMRVLEALGDFDGKQSIMGLMPQLEKDLEMILAPRIQNEGQKVIQRNGLLRGSRTRYRRGLVY